MSAALAQAAARPSPATLRALAGVKLETVDLPLGSLIPWANNPRRYIDDETAADLGQSILTRGLLQNLMVRPTDDDKFEVIVGNRRRRGMELKLEAGEIDASFPMRCTIVDVTDEIAALIAVAENMQRKSMNAIEECDALAEIAKSNPDVNEIARSIGLRPVEVAERIAVSGLEPDVKNLIAAGKRRIEWARAMTRLGATLRKDIMDSIAKSESSYVSVQQIAAFVRQKHVPAKNALFDVALVGLKVQADLLEANEGIILDREAFWVAQNAAIASLVRELERAGHNQVTVLRTEPFRDWEYEVTESPEGAIAVIEVAHDGLVTVHTCLQRRGGASAASTDDESDAGSIFDADASAVPEAALVSVTEQAPNAKAAEYLADIRMAAAATLVHNDAHMARAIVISGLVGNRDIGIDWPIYLRQGAELVAYNQIVTQASDDPLGYALALSDADQEAVMSVCASVRIRHQIGRKVAFNPESPVSRVLTSAREDGFNIRDDWTPNSDFLSLLTTQELRNLTTELLEIDEAGDVSHTTKNDLVVLLADAFESAKQSHGRHRAMTEIKLNSWVPNYI